MDSDNKYLDQSSDELHYSLFNTNKDVSHLNVLCQNSYLIGDIDLEYGILGASHFVKIYDSNSYTECYTEVFSCENVSSIKGDSVSFIDVNKSSSNSKFEIDRYKFSLEIERNISSDSYSYRNFISNISEEKKGLIYYFPSDNRLSVIQPVTAIYIEKKEGKGFKLRTLHSYPNEKTLVFTTTEYN